MTAIRPAGPDDVTAIQRVARTTWHATYDDILDAQTVDQQVDEWYADDVVREGITDDEMVYLVATADETVVGYATAGPIVDADGAASLYAIYVHPERWGEGVGSKLYGVVAKRLRQRGFDRLRVRVLADNDRARAFYERHGNTVTARDETELAGARVVEVTYAGPL